MTLFIEITHNNEQPKNKKVFILGPEVVTGDIFVGLLAVKCLLENY